MSFDSDPFLSTELVLRPTTGKFSWACPSCGAGAGIQHFTSLTVLWNSWVTHLMTSHALKPDDTVTWSSPFSEYRQREVPIVHLCRPNGVMAMCDASKMPPRKDDPVSNFLNQVTCVLCLEMLPHWTTLRVKDLVK